MAASGLIAGQGDPVQVLVDEIEEVIADYQRVWPVPYQLSANLLLLVRASALLVNPPGRDAPATTDVKDA